MKEVNILSFCLSLLIGIINQKLILSICLLHTPQLQPIILTLYIDDVKVVEKDVGSFHPAKMRSTD